MKKLDEKCSTYVPNPVPFDVVRELYDSDSYEVCKTRILCLGMNNNAKTLYTLHAVSVDPFHPMANEREPKIEDEYHVYNPSRDGTYFYVYDELFYRVLVWSKHPQFSDVIKGIVGQHTCIGLKRTGEIDVHSTIYKTDAIMDPNLANKSIHILNNVKVKIQYKVQGYDLVKMSPDFHPLDMAEECWDHILCFYDSKQIYLQRKNALTNGGGGGISLSSSKTKSKSKKTRDIYSLISAEKIHSAIRNLHTKEIVEKAAADMEDVYKHVKNNPNAYGMVRIPYISIAREKEFVKQINKHVRKDINTLVITDPHYKSSVMLINFDMFHD